jgi:hypothetical protein
MLTSLDAGRMGFRTYQAQASGNAVVVQSDRVPPNKHWVITLSAFLISGSYANLSNPPMSGIFACPSGNKPLETLGTTGLDVSARPFRLDDPSLQEATASGGVNLEGYQMPIGRMIYLPSGWFLQAIGATTVGSMAGAVGQLNIQVIEYDNCEGR